jgi:hypothetical protein
LVIDETDLDADSVVGDECHIRSGATAGPRHDPNFDPNQLNALPNLLLLCRVHHKMIDDQQETYTIDVLSSIKLNHEHWVESKLKESSEIPQMKWRRFKAEIPTKLDLVLSGKALFDLASNCHGSYQSYPDDLSKDEIEVVGGFLQNLKDWADLSNDLEPLEQLRATASLNDEVQALLAQKFMIFAARERQQISGGIGTAANMYVLHVTVARASDPNIIKPKERAPSRDASQETPRE